MSDLIREEFKRHYRSIKVSRYTIKNLTLIRAIYKVALLIAIAAGPITLWPVAIWIFVAILHVCLMIIDTLLIEVSMGKVLKALQEQEIYRGYDYVLWICDDMY